MKKEIANNTLSIVIDGMEMRTKDQLLATMKDALSFPDYFGMNWDALDEVLQDLSWLEDVEKVEITFTNSSQILLDGIGKDKSIFQGIMNSAIEYWGSEGKRLNLYVENKD